MRTNRASFPAAQYKIVAKGSERRCESNRHGTRMTAPANSSEESTGHQLSKIELSVNGHTREVEADPDTPLLYVLRDELALRGPRFGCGLGQCGACTVIIDGAAVRSCIYPVSSATGHSITTLEGLGSTSKPHPLQQAFIDEQAVQCGYCINGMIMTAKALLDTNPHPTEDEIKSALAANLCRCGTHMRIVRAVQRASKEHA
jgi:nicotinate dehydrogenase subunit A